MFDINAPISRVESADALPEGRHEGSIANIVSKTIVFPDGEEKERLIWEFTAAAGTASGFTGFVATQKSKLLDVLVNLGGLDKPLSQQIGRKVSFTVKRSGTGKAVVEMASVVPL
jgi:hypothetical protein